MYAFCAAIRIAYGDPDGVGENSRNGVHSTVNSGGYCTAKPTPFIKTLDLTVLQHPLMSTTPVR